LLECVVPQGAILGEDDPASLPDLRHPIHVLGVVVEVILFELDPLALRAKRLGDDFSSEALVEEEDKLTRPR
jgi:hypothetical protein